MKITAKFSTTCPCCNVRIFAGTEVEWAKGSPARHVACAPKPATAAAKPTARRQPMGSGHGQAGAVRGYSSYCTDNENCGCYDCAS
jgi:hypothetical protein